MTDDGAATGRESRAWLIQYLDVPGPEILRLRTYYNRGFNFQWACGYARLGATSIVPVAAIHGCGTYGFVPRAYDPGYIECGAVGSVYFTDRIHGFTDPNARGVTIRGTSCDQVVSRVYRQKIH